MLSSTGVRVVGGPQPPSAGLRATVIAPSPLSMCSDQAASRLPSGSATTAGENCAQTVGESRVGVDQLPPAGRVDVSSFHLIVLDLKIPFSQIAVALPAASIATLPPRSLRTSGSNTSVGSHAAVAASAATPSSALAATAVSRQRFARASGLGIIVPFCRSRSPFAGTPDLTRLRSTSR